MQMGIQSVNSEIHFSKHARQRLADRRIAFDKQDLARLKQAVDKVDKKGSKKSLIFLNDVAMVVSVKERTIVTAVDGQSAKENIFTNIDSAAIL